MEDKMHEVSGESQLLLVEKSAGLFSTVLRVLGELLHQNLQAEDDGSGSFLLNAGAELLYILEDPIRVQTCLRTIFEMTFDGMERTKQQE